jgi:hypothetical protein
VIHDFTGYHLLPPEDLKSLYCAVAGKLANLHEEAAMVFSTERRAKVEGFMRSQESSVSGREREADLHALESTTTLFELRGEIVALQEELGTLRMLLGVTDGRTEVLSTN